MENLIKRFEENIKKLSLDCFSGRVIVAFSGGADSAILLTLTHEYFSPRGVTVEAAHLNHMIRGREADRDEHFCVETSESLGIKLHVKRVDIPALCKNGGSVEEIARRERYAFFESLLTEVEKKTVVFTAHNADDNLETVLFNLTRGSALRGMCGIPPVRDGIYYRPILNFTSDEIRASCDKYGIRYVNDSTNFTDDYTRNFIRRNIVPSLARLSPDPQGAVSRMTESLRSDEDYLMGEAEKVLGDENFISADVMRGLHDAISSRVIMLMHRRYLMDKGLLLRLEKQHVDAVKAGLSEGKRFRVSLPGGADFLCDGEYCRFVDRGSRDVVVSDGSPTVLEPEVPVRKNGYVILLTRNEEEFIRKNHENIYNLSIHRDVKFDKIKGKLMLRGRMSGDLYLFGGMRRKVKKLFSEKGFPPRIRETIPVVYDENGIVWIPGFPVRDGVCEAGREDTFTLLSYTERENI